MKRVDLQALIIKIMTANKRIQRERSRQIAYEIWKDTPSEKENERTPAAFSQIEWGKTALEFVQKELDRIYGKGNADKFTTKGMTDEQLQQIAEAVDRVNNSKMLTAAGRKEQARNNTAQFFMKSPEDVTQREMNILKQLDDKGVLDKMKELNWDYNHLFEALEMVSHFVNREDISLSKKVKFLDALINNKDGLRDRFTTNGRLDYYGPLGAYVNEELAKTGD